MRSATVAVAKANFFNIGVSFPLECSASDKSFRLILVPR